MNIVLQPTHPNNTNSPNPPNSLNPFHLVNVSPWPIIASISAISLTLSTIILINKNTSTPMLIAIIITSVIATIWWNDVFRESSNQGNHPNDVTNGLNTGIILFITSEVLFFSSFFWAFFHSSISPNIEIGQTWPPLSITPFNPICIPLLNTIILVSSGVSITWSHHEILNENYQQANNSLGLTIILGVIFSALQGFEYLTAPFTISDSVIGSSFFIATGFHGLHVLIGSTFLATAHARLKSMSNTNTHIIGFECAAWYWHFVDVVWLFLYTTIYWWGA